MGEGAGGGDKPRRGRSVRDFAGTRREQRKAVEGRGLGVSARASSIYGDFERGFDVLSGVSMTLEAD